MPKIAHFEISCDDMQRAGKFYERVFGWQVDKTDGEDDDYYLISGADDEDDYGVTGGLTTRAYPTDSTVITYEVESVDRYAKTITEAGGKVLAPKISLPGVGYLVYCYDTESNIFGVMEYDESAQ
ncbi:MAG TPA: VOC family protein [Pyrinomonadaceae bacterium]|jgi:predicted enzyme related to lactoylglutathione lyase|nr:VOC family protein [Pyrinomonadaceae bacterium]